MRFLKCWSLTFVVWATMLSPDPSQSHLLKDNHCHAWLAPGVLLNAKLLLFSRIWDFEVSDYDSQVMTPTDEVCFSSSLCDWMEGIGNMKPQDARRDWVVCNMVDEGAWCEREWRSCWASCCALDASRVMSLLGSYHKNLRLCLHFYPEI